MAFRKKETNHSQIEDSQLLVADNPLSHAADEFRILRTNIQYAYTGNDLHTLAVTSPNSGEGKTTLAANLAASFAQERTMVLLVDANLREPAIHTVLGVQNGTGLTDLLTNKQLNFGETIRESPLNNLHVMTAGKKPLNPAELLNSSRMEAIMERMKNRYDLVIFDTPAILSATDAQLIAAKVDTTLLAYSPEATSAEDLKEATTLLNHVHAHILGTIRNNS